MVLYYDLPQSYDLTLMSIVLTLDSGDESTIGIPFASSHEPVLSSHSPNVLYYGNQSHRDTSLSLRWKLNILPSAQVCEALFPSKL